MMTTTTRWLSLEGADNVRDLGGLPTRDGATVRHARLIRADSLQSLSPADVRVLVDDIGVRAVADLRTRIEVSTEGPGPMTREPRVRMVHLSLFPEDDDAARGDGADSADDRPVLLPWQRRSRSDRDAGAVGDDPPDDDRRKGVSAVYLGYLDDRADSVLAALRLVAHTNGATIVHCAAGKDRTGVIVALALTVVGVERDAVVADYALSAERVPAILSRLAGRRTYAGDLGWEDVDRHKPRAVTMERFLDAVDTEHGGVDAWLRAHGWTDADADALRARLLG